MSGDLPPLLHFPSWCDQGQLSFRVVQTNVVITEHGAWRSAACWPKSFVHAPYHAELKSAGRCHLYRYCVAKCGVAALQLRCCVPKRLFSCTKSLDQRNVSCVQSAACRTLCHRQSQSNLGCCGSEPCVHRPPDGGCVVGK